MGCGNVGIANDNPFNREVLGGRGLFLSTTKEFSACIDSVDSGAADIAGMKVNVVERVKQLYTWDRITDYYCELISLSVPKSRDRSEIVQCAPHLPDEAKVEVVSAI